MKPTKKILARGPVADEDISREKTALNRNWTVYHEIGENQNSSGGYLPDTKQVFGLSLRTGGQLETNFRQFLDRINFLS